MLLLAFLVMQPTQHVLAVVEHSSSFSRPSFSTSLLLSIDRVANPSYSRNMMSSSSFMKNASDANSTLTIVTISNNGSFLPNTTYSVSPYPASSNITKLTITDDGPEDANKVTRGIISIPRLRYGS